MTVDYPPGVTGPTPRHALTVAAQAARDAVVEYGRANPQQLVRDERKGTFKVKRRPLIAPELDVTTSVPQPWERIDLDELTGTAKAFAREAVGAGHEVAAKRAGRAVCVAVKDPRIRAYWLDGKGTGVILGNRCVTQTEAKAAL